ncbi:homocysteine S-methyltransferase family protein [Vibrio cincinnatiensis]
MSTHAVRILDGGMGRELERRKAPFRQPEWSALALMEAPEIVEEVHQAFIESGAQLITSNSYALVPFHIGEKRFSSEGLALADLAGKVARQAVVNAHHPETLVAGSLPPLFGSYRADLYQPEKAEQIATPLIQGLTPYVDLWLAETQSLIEEALELHRLVKALDNHNKPFWVSFTLEDSEATTSPTLRSGQCVEEAVKQMASSGVSAILFNCCQPEVIEDALRVTKHTLTQLGHSNIELGAYANAFPPQPKTATANDGLDELRDDLTPLSYLDWAQRWQQQGASLIGGCCGIGPEHIALLSQHFASSEVRG